MGHLHARVPVHFEERESITEDTVWNLFAELQHPTSKELWPQCLGQRRASGYMAVFLEEDARGV